SINTNATTASVKPRLRPLLALAPSTMSKYKRTTWAWSMWPRTEYMATVAPASSIDQRIQATAGCSVCSGAAPIFGSRARTRRPRKGRAPFARTAVVTSAYDVGAIADAGFRDHDPWRCRIDLDLPPKVRDMDAKVLLRTAELATPHGVEDLLVGEGAATRADERTENLPFDRCEMNLPAVAVDAACDGIDTG